MRTTLAMCFSLICRPWGLIISAYVENREPELAMNAYRHMRSCKAIPTDHTFIAVLKACASLRDLDSGRLVHADAVNCTCMSNLFVSNTLVDMYAKCGSLSDARAVFDTLATKSVVTWNVMITGYVQQGLGQEALNVYERMQIDGVAPDKVTFLGVLRACGKMRSLQRGKEIHAQILELGLPLHKGKQLHAQILERGFEADEYISNALAYMYVTCGSLEDAERLFNRLPTKDVVTWNAMIQGNFQRGQWEESFNLYERMRQDGITPNRVTFMCMLRYCAGMGDFEKGKEIHVDILENKMEADTFVMNTLVNMYSRLGALRDARTLFDRLLGRDVVTWNAIIEGYAQHGLGQEALNLYENMQQDGLVPDKLTFLAISKACASLGVLEKGRELHAQILAAGQESEEFVGNSLVDMYAKCGGLEDARKVFDSLPVRSTVTWNAMIEAFVHNGHGFGALQTYERMLKSGVLPDKVTYLSTLKACGCTGAIQTGKSIHSQLVEQGLAGDVSVRSAIVDMYAKCGDLAAACSLMNGSATSDVVTWTALINGYGKQNNARMAIQCFEDMLQHGVEPNSATFTCLIVACSHGSLVDEGQQYFNLMVEGYGIHPTLEPSNSMVDLLARSGHLDAAEHMLRVMLFEPNVAGWLSVLSSCRKYGDVERGRTCFDHLTKFEPELASAYVLMRGIYADAGRWEELDNIQKLGRHAGAQTKPAFAYIEVNNKVQEFVVGQERPDTSVKLQSLSSQLTLQGHVPQTELVLKNLPDRKKEDALCGHAEKLALAFGLLNTSEGTSLLVTKSLRMCNDCHCGTKMLSKIEQRSIIVRDAHRIHHFRDGLCSCEDGGR